MTPPPTRASGTPDERAVSDLIGFVLVFSLVAAIVAIVSVAGLGTLEDVRQAEQTDNAERAMEVLSDNMADIYRRGAPSRATEISLEDASVRLGAEVLVEVRDPDSGSGDSSFLENRTFQIQPIVYDDGETELVYVMGAVFRDDPRGGTIVEPWSPTLNENQTLIPVPRTISATDGSQQLQSSTVLVRANANNRVVPVANASASFDDVYINVTSPRRDLWERMLSRHSELSCTTPGPQTVTCELGYTPDQLYVIETRIAVTLKR